MSYTPPPSTPPTVRQESFSPGDKFDVKTHPAFGMLRFARINGSSGRLFGSELESGHFIRLTLCPGEEHWHLHEKRYMSTSKTLVEVDLTASQFAELITTLNSGCGVPCTVRRVNGVEQPNFIDEDTLSNKIKADLADDVKTITGLVNQLKAEAQATLDESGLGKARKEKVMELIYRIQREVSANMPFVLDQYTEAVDKVTASVKAEVDSFVTHVTTQLGIESLKKLNEAHNLSLPHAQP